MNKTVKVITVETSKTKAGGDFYKIKVNDGEKDLYFNSFDAMQGKALMKASTTDQDVVLDLEEDGEWLNLKKIVTEIKDTDGVAIPTASPKKAFSGGFGGGKADPEKIQSIEKQSALKQSVEYSINQTDSTVESVLATADLFYEWMIKPEEPFKS